MRTLNTLNSLIDDILLIVRNSNISASENINRAQIEQWLSQYRSKLIKDEMDRNKSKKISEEFVTHKTNVELEKVYDTSSQTCQFRTSIEIPKLISTAYTNGLLYVTDPVGNEIQIVPYTRQSKQKYRKYTCKDYTAVYKDNRVYVDGPGNLTQINFGIIPEDPGSLSDDCDFPNSPYPVPAHRLDELKKLIFQSELNFMLGRPTDMTNDSTENNSQRAGYTNNTRR